MQRREKILLALLVAAVLGWQGWPILRATLLAPIDERLTRIRSLDKNSGLLDVQEAAMLDAMSSMGKWRARSFPPEPLVAQRLYQEWLTDVAQLAGISALRVAPEPLQTFQSVGGAYKGVRVSVKGEATFPQLITFLYHFRRTDLLHRVAALKLEAPASEGGPLKVSVTAEGLCLPDAEPRDALFPRAQLADSLPRSFTTLKLVTADSFPTSPGFLARIENEVVNVTKTSGNEWTVTRGADGTTAARHAEKSDVELVPVRFDWKDVKLADQQKLLAAHPFAKPSLPRRDPNDVAAQTKLMGSLIADDDQAAWLYNDSTKVRTLVRKGTSVSIADIQGVVVSVEPSFVQIKRGSEVWQLDFGKSLRSMTRVGAPADGDVSEDLFMDSGLPSAGERSGFGGGQRGGFGGGQRGSFGGGDPSRSRRSRRSTGGSPMSPPNGGDPQRGP